MKKEQWKKEQKDYTPDPLFADLADNLKDPACYTEVVEQILKAGESGHEHKAMIVWKRCKHCQQKFLERRAKVRELGFQSYQQFLKWKKIMDIIINKREIYLKKPNV